MTEVVKIKLNQQLEIIIEEIIQNNYLVLNILRKLEDAIIFSIGKLHPAIISTKVIRAINYQLKSLYNPKQLITFENLFTYYNYFNIHNYLSSKELMFKISVPILHLNTFELYHIYPIPYHNQIVQIAEPYMVLSSSTYASRSEICPKLEEIYICNDHPILRDQNCVLKLMENINNCQTVPVDMLENFVQQIGAGDVLVFAPKLIKCYYSCIEHGIIELKDNNLIKLKPNCSIKIENESIYYKTNVIEGEVFYLPKLTIKELPNLNQINAIELNKINLKNIHNLQTNINNRKIVRFENISHHSIANTVLIVLFVIILFIVLIKKYFICIKSCIAKDIRNEDPHVGTKLSGEELRKADTTDPLLSG